MCLGITIADNLINKYVEEKREFEKTLSGIREEVASAQKELEDLADDHWREFHELAQNLGMDTYVFNNLWEQGLIGRASNE